MKNCGVAFVAGLTMQLCCDSVSAAATVTLPTETLVANSLYALLISIITKTTMPYTHNPKQSEEKYSVKTTHILIYIEKNMFLANIHQLKNIF